MRVAFIGVGAIGSPMARRLLPAFDVAVYDPDAARVRELESLGAYAAASAADASRGADATIVMVASPAQLETALFGADGVATGADEGSTIIIMSSVGVDSVVDAGDQLIARGLRVVDAPVTGGVARATTGELTILLGGTPHDIENVEPILQSLGTKLASCGTRPGDGQSVKLVNQLLCATHLVAAAEALSLAAGLGLDPEQVLSIVETGAAGSFMLSDRGPRMLSDDAPVLSAIDIFVKDADLVADAARDRGIPTPLLNAAQDRFHAARESGLGRDDDSSVIRMYRSSTELASQA
ncbi:NAD(P)-dependent oxidoreductase [Microbacterium sp. NPDC058062]|uniref:NAD(P)-dependent oxidoreductase n=1 Tax=Microbacterium sp. NPDC058062 TaxID=3346320 RepID=UPI0036D7D15D